MRHYFIFEQFIGFPQEVSHGEWDLLPFPPILSQKRNPARDLVLRWIILIYVRYIYGREGYSAARVSSYGICARARYKRAEPKYE